MEYTQWESIFWQSKLCRCLNPCCNGIYSMRSTQAERWRIRQLVLILVVMEYTQWEQNWKVLAQEYPVLILVVMEYTQWEYPINNNKLWKYGLNPCCNGIYSMSKIVK